MIRHGQSVANLEGYYSGNLDVALTDLGITQAETARQHVESLDNKPLRIVHSHLQRARNTAKIINQNLQLPMHETPLLGEQHFGDWEKTPHVPYKSVTRRGNSPPNGETNHDFEQRIAKGINKTLESDELPLIACHGGVFRAFYELYNNIDNFEATQNCVLYEFTPNPSAPHFPWNIEAKS